MQLLALGNVTLASVVIESDEDEESALDRDSPDWVAGTMTVIYLLALLVLISLMF